MYEPQITLTENGNLLIHVPMLVRRQRGRKCSRTFSIGSVESRSSLARHRSAGEAAKADAERGKPRQWSLAKLLKGFPEDWEEQRKWFGVESKL